MQHSARTLLNINTESIRGFRTDVEPERLDHGEDDVNFRILDDHGFNLVAVIIEHPVQEVLESLLVAQKRLESCVEKRIEVLVLLDFFIYRATLFSKFRSISSIVLP